jgi:CHAT domain-containing protein
MTIKNIQRIMTSKTKIAILSACQTGVGRIYRNAYSSIGRCFFIAGVDNCIMSLWDLNDYDIIGFMKILIEELKTPRYFYPAENLRQAILKFRRINPDKLWSSMVNFGICY